MPATIQQQAEGSLSHPAEHPPAVRPGPHPALPPPHGYRGREGELREIRAASTALPGDGGRGTPCLR
jgi:hypothetical protein